MCGEAQYSNCCIIGILVHSIETIAILYLYWCAFTSQWYRDLRVPQNIKQQALVCSSVLFWWFLHCWSNVIKVSSQTLWAYIMYCSLLIAFILINGTLVPPCQPRIKILRSQWVSTQGVRASYWKSHHHFLDIVSWASRHGASSALLYAHTSRIYVQEVWLYLPLTLLLIFNFNMQINSQFSCIFVYLNTGLGFSPLVVVEYFKLQTDKDQPNLYTVIALTGCEEAMVQTGTNIKLLKSPVKH